MKKLPGNILVTLSFLLMPVFFANSARGAVLPDSTIKAPEKISSHSVFFSLGYGDNLILGSSISKPQKFYYGSLTYGFKNEFFLSASSFYLPGFNEIPAYDVFSASYNHAFNSWFDIALSTSGFMPHNKLADSLFQSFLFADITIGLDWKIMYTKISASRVLAGTGSFVQVRNSRYFQTPEFFSGKMYVSFDPYFNLLFGSLTKITTAEGTSIGVSSPVWSGGGSGSGSGSGTGSGSGNGSGTGSGSTGTTTVTKTSDFFGLMEMDFGVPVGLNTERVTIEVEPGYVVPMFTDPSIPSPKGFSLMLSCFIRIF